MITIEKGRPRFGRGEAERIAKELYDLTGEVHVLPSERDQNYLLTGAKGRRYVLKIANRAEPAAVLDLQIETLQHLTSKVTDLSFPQVIPCKNGRLIGQALDNAGTTFHVRLLSYVPGRPLIDVRPHTADLLRALGQLLGRVDVALLGIAHPVAYRFFQWNVRDAHAIIGERLEHVADPARRSLVEHFVQRFERNVYPLLATLRSGLIYNDGNDHNVLVTKDPGGEYRIAGLVDFGDMVHGPYVYEPAVASAYAMLGTKDPLEVASEVVAGFHQVFPLLPSEVDILFDLIAIRLCTSVVLSAYQQPKEPDLDYLSVSETAAWELLEWLISVDPRVCSDDFRRACHLPLASAGRSRPDKSGILALRRELVGPSLSVSYHEPLHIVRGFRQFLYDETGRAYLDGVNNVAHVGHCHPKVVRAGQEQMAILNTNTRYLHDLIVLYAERLIATMPDPLRVCYFVCSGSEANELALRMARAHTCRRDILVLDGAYHGNTTSLVEISPYKFDGPGGQGKPDHVHQVTMPDPYRGRFRSTGDEAAAGYAREVELRLAEAEGRGNPIGAFIAEPLMGCGGQIVFPGGYLAKAFEHVRAAGGVCIADEVQVGFGRVGTHFWGFEVHGVVPDIITLGKPMGNGHPLAAVVTTPEIAASFDNGMEYFNTFGGNPVSCAIGLAVLEVLEGEALQANALRVGGRLKQGLQALGKRQALIGDVRGRGLFLGLELVRDRTTLEPAAVEATRIAEMMKDRGILLSTDGPLHNVIKIKPPLVFSEEDADRLVETLDDVLSSDELQMALSNE